MNRYLFRAPIVIMHRLTEKMSTRNQQEDMEMSSAGPGLAVGVLRFFFDWVLNVFQARSRSQQRLIQKRGMRIPGLDSNNIRLYLLLTSLFDSCECRALC